LEQHVLFPQEFLHLRLNGTPAGNVLECQKHGGVGPFLIKDLTLIKKHDAPTGRRKLSIDFVSFDRRAAGCDRFQKVPKLEDVPLTAVNLVKSPPNDVVSHEPKSLEEGAAGGDDTQILIENHEWIADGIDGGLAKAQVVPHIDVKGGVRRKRKSVPDIDERDGFRWKRSEHMNLSPRFSSSGKAALIFLKKVARTPKTPSWASIHTHGALLCTNSRASGHHD